MQRDWLKSRTTRKAAPECLGVAGTAAPAKVYSCGARVISNILVVRVTHDSIGQRHPLPAMRLGQWRPAETPSRCLAASWCLPGEFEILEMGQKVVLPT
ncbi:MAG TPA: hypothetical protein P5572_19305, partial [Phycisphaerae bacterium]|nr:hypothetical protein [Phycisphaerae bacterium]